MQRIYDKCRRREPLSREEAYRLYDQAPLQELALVADEVRRARDAGACIVVVTHDYEFVCAACDQVAVLEDGVVSDVLPVRGEALGRIRRAIGIDGRARPL